MVKTSFSYSAYNIDIFTKEKIGYALADTLNTLINLLSKEINHSIYDSSAYRFNESKSFSPVLVSKDFIEFLTYCVDVNNLLLEQVKIFYSTPKIKISAADSTIIKQEDFILDSSKFRKEFLLDLLNTVLKNNKINSFLISSETMHSAFGDDEYEVKLSISNAKVFKTRIKNKAIAINTFPKLEVTNSPSKFASKDYFVNARSVISMGRDLTEAKINFFNLSNLSKDSEYKLFSEASKSRFYIVDEAEKVLEYHPIKS